MTAAGPKGDRRSPPLRALAAAVLALAPVLAAPSARSEVVRFEIVSREVAAPEERSRGDRGAAERITARATVSLDPDDPRNAVLADIALAPRDARGRVEAVTDVVVLRPTRPSGTLLLEVLNRGRAVLPGLARDADATPAGAPAPPGPPGIPDEVGDGFLLARGFTLVWPAWQFDAPVGPRLRVPVLAGATGPAREEFSLADAPAPARVRLSYPVADRASARLTVRDGPGHPRTAPPGLGLRFLDDAAVEVDRPAGLPPDALYEIVYTAREPVLSGLGLAALRDVAAFLRREGGPANPLAAGGRSGIDRAVAVGVSQSGRVLRDLLHLGLNEDESGRVVFDAMMPVLAGARRSFTNARFAQPGRNPGPRHDRLFPVLEFPFAYPVTDDHPGSGRDGLLRRCRSGGTCPKVFHVDSEFEFWGAQASLVATDARGNPLAMPPDVRLFLLAGAPHGNAPDAVARPDPGCVLPLNPVQTGPAVRALLVALEAWVRDGVAPPASRYPDAAAGTLVPADRVHPAPIPGLSHRGDPVPAERVEQAVPWPRVTGVYPLLLPRAGLDGHAVAGLRLPPIAAPRATYVGWNPRREAGREGELCQHVGGVVPFAATEAARAAAADPRPSLEALYPGPGTYEAAVRAAAARLVAERLLLPGDAETAVAAAREGRLARLGRLEP